MYISQRNILPFIRVYYAKRVIESREPTRIAHRVSSTLFLPPDRVTIVGGFKQEEANLDKWNVRTKLFELIPMANEEQSRRLTAG